MSVEAIAASVVVAENVAEDGIVVVFMWVARVDVSAASLLVPVEKAAVVKRVEESVVLISIVFFVVVEETSEVFEEAVFTAKMVRTIIIVIVETAEEISKVPEWRATPTAALLERLIAHLIALSSLLGIGENLIGGADFLEFLLGFGLFVFVRVILDGEFPEGFLHFPVGRGRTDSQNGVVFTFCQRQRYQAARQQQVENPFRVGIHSEND